MFRLHYDILKNVSYGEVLKWLKRSVSKTDRREFFPCEGSNPSFSIDSNADLAQLAERIISNDEVNSSNLLVGTYAEVVQW